MKKNKLPKELTTVTPFSKFIALCLFVILPFGGFVVGMKYQEKVDSINESTPISINQPAITPTPTIDTSNWKTQILK